LVGWPMNEESFIIVFIILTKQMCYYLKNLIASVVSIWKLELLLRCGRMPGGA
jgi:hypothetical protein